MDSLPPGAILILGALLVPLLPGKLRQLYMLALPVVSFWHLWNIPQDHTLTFALFDYD